MKKRFTILMMMLFILLGGAKWNVLNAQEENCSVIFTLTDSYGDGWNGNKLVVTYGTVTKELTISANKKPEGELYIETLEIPTGTDVNVTFISSSGYGYGYPQENGFTIEYDSGEVIVSVAPGTYPNNTYTNEEYTFTVDCTPKAPITPVVKAIVTGESTIDLEITAIGADSYTIYQNSEVIATGLTAGIYTVENLTPNTEYCFTVKSVNEVGESELSEPAYATTFEEGTRFITIGEGEIAIFSAPIYNAANYNYSLSQVIYTKDEIGLENNAILKSISYHQADGNNNTRDIVVYLQNVDKTLFDGNYDWIPFTESDIVYQGEISFGKSNDWITIDFSKDFKYTGGNLAVTVYDKTGTSYGYNYDLCDKFYHSQINEARGMYYTNPNEMNLSQITTFYGTIMNTGSSVTPKNVYFINNVKFRVGALEPIVNVYPNSIAFGNVKVGNYWTEKGATKVPVTINVKNTEIKNISIDNDFFLLPDIDLSANNIEFDLTCDVVNGEAKIYTADLAIEYGNKGEKVYIPVTAVAYTPAQGDVVEKAIEVTFTDNAFSHSATGMYDDYILPGETVDGNLKDAVYTFTLENESVVTANVNGTNAIAAIYKAEDLQGNGPSSDNNNTGVQSGPTGPTTFFYDFNDGDLSDFTLIDADGDGKNWVINGYGYLESNSYLSGSALTPNNYIVTNTAYSITQNSKLSFDVLTYIEDPEHCAVVVTSDINDFTKYTIVYEETFNTEGNYPTKEIDLSLFKDQTLYIGLRHYNSTNEFKIFVDNLTLTDGSSKTRSGKNQIKGAHYSAGTYYLVAAAEGDFTLNLKREDYIAIDAPQIEGSGSTLNKYVGETVTLEWSTVDGVDGYRVYNGEDVLAELEGGEIDNYTTVLQDYNVTPGYTFYVTAYIGENESPKSEPIYVKVSGDVNINGTLTNGAGATLTFTGTDEFGQAQTYTTIVGNDGSYTIEEINAGHYTMTASKFDYQDFSEEINIVYSVESVTLEHAMVEKPAAGNAIYSVSMSETQSGATVRWSANTAQNANQAYNIYRKDVESGVVTPIAQGKNLTQSFNGQYWDGSYEDDTYSSLPDGKSYQYGVTAMVAGEPVEVMREGFENNYTNLPNGWTKTGTATVYGGSGYYNSGSYGCYLYSATLTSPNIDLSAYMSSSISFYCKNSSNTKLYLKVKATDSNAWTIVAEVSNIYSFNKITAELPDSFKGKVIQIMFDYQGTSYPAIDDIVISASLSVESKAVWSTPLKKGLNTFTNKADGDDWNKWEVAANWSKGLPTSESEVIINGSVQIASDVTVKSLSVGSGYLTINSAASLTVTDELINITSNKLIILDGGQLFHHSEDVKATFVMNIHTPKSWSVNKTEGWQFISSPITNANTADFKPQSETDYDLFKYDGTQESQWVNYKSHDEFEKTFQEGRGYIVSYEAETTADFVGILNNASSFDYEVAYDAQKDLANFHLLGNPFSFDMDWNNVQLNNVYNGFATVNPATGGYVISQGKGSIPVGDGFFVETIGEEPSISYNAGSKSRGEEKADYINIIATGAEGSNNLIVKFSGAEEKGFSKLENINTNIADIYVKNDGRHYSILGYDMNTSEIEIFFDAKQMGNYSISLDVNGKFESVVLVDRLTGIETNMLIEDEYSFTATSNENPNRFVLKLDNGQESTDNSHFVYQSGEELILTIEGSVQIVDMLGRIVYSNDVVSDNNRIDVSNFNKAAYIVRVINETGVKVEKVVIY